MIVPISFEDPIVISENSIISIDKKGIKHSNGYIDFNECASNFTLINSTDITNCVADRDITGSNPSLDFYTTGRVTQLFFISKSKTDDLLSKSNTLQRFYVFNERIYLLGWTTRDIS